MGKQPVRRRTNTSLLLVNINLQQQPVKLSFIDPVISADTRIPSGDPKKLYSLVLFGQLSLTQQEGHQRGGGRWRVVLSGSGLGSVSSGSCRFAVLPAPVQPCLWMCKCNSVREGSGFFQDDLIPGSEIIHLQLHHCSSGQQDKLVNEPITSSSERYFLLLW